jgi:hypothetical protein
MGLGDTIGTILLIGVGLLVLPIVVGGVMIGTNPELRAKLKAQYPDAYAQSKYATKITIA